MSENNKIIITGDCCPGIGRVEETAIKGDAASIFGEFLPMIKDAGLAITNLESPLLKMGKKITKTGPAIKSPPESIELLEKAGFDLVTLANNHIMDFGKEGLESTLKTCRNAGIETVGAGTLPEEIKKNYYFELDEKKISVINMAENEFGTSQYGSPGGNSLNPVDNYYAISEAKKKSDRVIVIVHGGHEHITLPSPRMKKEFRFFVDAGADAVICHHSHCISGYEVYNDAPIFYGIGNFLFDKGQVSISTTWNTGMIVELLIDEVSFSFDYHFFIQNGLEVGLLKPDAIGIEHLENKLDQLNSIIADDKRLEREFKVSCEDAHKRYSSYIEPHSFRILHFLRNRNLIPSFLSKRKKLLLLNLTRCEAHREMLTYILTNENSNT